MIDFTILSIDVFKGFCWGKDFLFVFRATTEELLDELNFVVGIFYAVVESYACCTIGLLTIGGGINEALRKSVLPCKGCHEKLSF